MKGLSFLIGMVAAAAVAVAGVVLLSPQRAPEPAPEPAAPPAEAAVSPAEPGNAPAPPDTEMAAPRFDLVRVEPDGRATIAGAALDAGTVSVLVDGAEAARVAVDGSGGFVAYVAIPEGDGVRRLDLESALADGRKLRSTEPVFVSAPRRHEPDSPPPEPTVVRATDEGAVEIIQAPAPADEGTVTLDAVSYDDDGAVVLSGRADPEREVAVYADGELVGRALTQRDGRWRAESINALAPGAYTLRVDEIAPDGQVESRIESPFARAEPGSLSLASGEIVVQPGDTLWRIAQEVYGGGLRYTVIYSANAERIRDPDLIYPGQVFAIPPRGAAN